MRMTSMLGVVLTAVVLAAVAPAAPEGSAPCGHEAGETVHLRTAPSGARPALGRLRPGDAVTVLRRSGDWYHVTAGTGTGTGTGSRPAVRAGTEGWVPLRHIRPRACAPGDGRPHPPAPTPPEPLRPTARQAEAPGP
ncbi:SH3 domain-containing protein [Streptomyces omiyaensis]|uniref:SH3 domain-containing protein n=1 Tax=Streptomyces omiyaensis TaxID=68247 RepID=UPI0036FD8166